MSEDDLLRAIEKLGGLGSGFGVVRIGAKSFVRSVPTELSTDSNALIDLAEVSEVGVVRPLFSLGGACLLGLRGMPACLR